MSGPARILHIDATAGASGDMCLGALVAVGVPLAAIRRAVARLPISGYRLTARHVLRGAVAATKVDVRLGKERDRYAPGRGRRIHHSEGDHQGAHGTTWSDIRRIVGGGRLSPDVEKRALAVFRRLFEAEGAAHGKPAGRVHLHEVGAVDAIVDIVGTCAGIARLAPDRIVVSPMTTGSGTVTCSHGIYPVPGPATAWLVCGAPLSGIEADGERLTPTGAALLTTLADDWGGLPAMRPTAVGYGAGDRDFPERPNLLRMTLGEASRAVARDGEGQALVLEFTVDDATPQLLAFAGERLFEAGALDVYTTPVHMKKGRSGHLVTVLARPGDLNALASVALAETTTLGLRYRVEGRVELERVFSRVRTAHGAVRVKSGMRDGVELHAWPEYEDCAAAARRSGVTLHEVQMAALEAHRRGRKPKASGRRKET